MIRACHDVLLVRGGPVPGLPPRQAQLTAHDVCGGWLIFDLPEADMGCHPARIRRRRTARTTFPLLRRHREDRGGTGKRRASYSPCGRRPRLWAVNTSRRPAGSTSTYSRDMRRVMQMRRLSAALSKLNGLIRLMRRISPIGLRSEIKGFLLYNLHADSTDSAGCLPPLATSGHC